MVHRKYRLLRRRNEFEEKPAFIAVVSFGSNYCIPPPLSATQSKILLKLSRSLSPLCVGGRILPAPAGGSEKKTTAKNVTVGRKILRPFYRNKSTAAIEEKYKRH
jgi:hypothetical protein